MYENSLGMNVVCFSRKVMYSLFGCIFACIHVLETSNLFEAPVQKVIVGNGSLNSKIVVSSVWLVMLLMVSYSYMYTSVEGLGQFM